MFTKKAVKARKRWIFGLLLLGLLFGPALAQANSTTFRIAAGVSVRTMDPTATTRQVTNMMDYMLETLVVMDENGTLLPGLAESWEVGEDGRSVTFSLREGVTFHDGTPLTAEAVKFSLERWLDPVVRAPTLFAQELFHNLESLDDLTLRIDTLYSAPLMLANLVYTVYAVISPESVNEHGNVYDPNNNESLYVHPIGTGPYRLAALEPDKMVLTRFDDYWGEAPYYETVEFLFVPEAATRESLLLAGQVDMMVLPPIADLPALETNPGVEVLTSPDGPIIYLAFNTQDPALQDVRVRQALNYAVDKEAITEGLLLGFARPATSPVSAYQFGHCHVGPYPYDPERAQALLAEAGVSSLQLTFAAPTGRFLQDFQIAQAVSAYLAQVGVTTNPTTSDYSAFINSLFVPASEQTIQLHLLGYTPNAPDAALGLLYTHHKEQEAPRGLNTAYYLNDEVSALIDEAMGGTDPEERAGALCEAQRLIWEEAPWLYLHEQPFIIAHRTGLEGIGFRDSEKFYAIYARPAP